MAAMSQFTTHISLLQRLTSGADADAWTEFHDRYGQLIRNMARRKGLQDADCDEVVQEVLTALTRSMPGFEYDPARGKFRGYLKTVTLRKIFSRAASKEVNIPVQQLQQVETDPAFESVWESEWRQYHLRQAMRVVAAEFNATDLAAFESYVIHGDSTAETARKVGISTDQIYQAKSRILRKLQQIIERQIDDEG